MSAVDAQQLLATWEEGLALTQAGRGLALLRVACPNTPSDELRCWSIGRRDEMLMRLRGAVFGPRVVGVSRCPSCAGEIEIGFALDDIHGPSAGATPVGQEIQVEGWSVRFRLPDSTDFVALEECSSEEEARLLLFEACVIEARRGDRPSAPRDLPPTVQAEVARTMEKADPLADVQLALDCPACGDPWQESFDIAAFLWTEIDTWARRLLSEIHLLARAYGWREGDILALSPLRRQAYLQLARG